MELFRPFRAVLVTSHADPALDTDAMLEEIECADGEKRKRVSSYLATRDEALLACIPGLIPRWFSLAPIKARDLNRIVADLAQPSGDELWAIVARCLLSADGLEVERKAEVLTSESMDRLADEIGLAGIRELGEAVLRRTVPPKAALAPFASRGG